MLTLPKGTRLYRAIDTTPDQVVDPLHVNGEGVLWCATDSGTAQTYIPGWGLLGGYSIPDKYRLDESATPRDDLTQALIRQCGGEIKIYDREFSIPVEKAADHDQSQVIYRDGVAKIGRPMSWSIKPQVTWRAIVGELERQGYDTKAENGFLWLKMGKDDFGRPAIVHSSSRFQGTLLIMETQQELIGSDRRKGDLLDPDYHHAHQIAREEARQDFFIINDYCQTQQWGNVAHTSHAILPSALGKLKLVAKIPAYHNDWADCHPNTLPSEEELAWEKERAAAALPPLPDLRCLPLNADVPIKYGRMI